MKTQNTNHLLPLLILSGILFIWPDGSAAQNEKSRTPLEQASSITQEQIQHLYKQVHQQFQKLEPQSIKKANGYIPHDYLIPAGYYTQMWDWDGFFIGCHLAAENPQRAKYLKWWVLNFAKAIDDSGYVSGCITPKGPRPVFGKFAMKPFLSQGALIASRRLGTFQWIESIYLKLKEVLAYREKTQLDPHYGLFYWDNAGESGADNSVVLTNAPNDRGAIIAADMNTWQLREYLSMSLIARHLGHIKDATYFSKKAQNLKKAMLHYLWFPQDHSFWNIRRDGGEPIKRVSFQNFIPLFQGLLPLGEGRAMIKKYLWNTDYMLSGFGLRSLSKQDPDYNNRNIIVPYSNWRGPIWINANYLYSIMLVRYGFKSQARELSYMIGTLVLKDAQANGSLHEDYNAETGAPLAPTAEQSGGKFMGFVGWDLLAEDMLQGAFTGKWMMLEIK